MSDIKRSQLRKHKRFATGLFFLMGAVYILMVYLQHQEAQPWMGYVEAFSEAGMVGALADWFAVTALFKHPLGLPIPHTNLIERKKNDLGENLGKFVRDNFLNPQNIRFYIEKLDVVTWIAEWLAKSKSKEVLETEVVNLAKKIILDLEDSEVESFLAAKGADTLRGVDYQKITSTGVQYFVEKNEHIKLLEMLLPQVKMYVTESREMIHERLSNNRPFIAFLAGKKISKEVVEGLIKFIEEIQEDKSHFVRRKLTENLQSFSLGVVQSESWKLKFDSLKDELITPDSLKPYTDDAWKSIKEILLQNLENPDSQLKDYLRKKDRKSTRLNSSHVRISYAV